jgi:UDP-N-acetylglucosamine acyltransferase
MACAHIAHDCIIGDNVIIGYSTGIAGHVEIDDNAILSAGIGVHQFCKIGKAAIIGGGAMVTMDIIPYVTAQGDRVVITGLNLIGLKRKKVKLSEIKNIKDAYRILFTSKLSLEESVVKLKRSSSEYVKDIVRFIENSQRGIARPKQGIKDDTPNRNN